MIPLWTYGGWNNDPEPSLTPPEPEPVASCAICGEDCYNEDYIIDGEVVCPACDNYFYSDEIVLDYCTAHKESLMEFISDNICESWFQDFLSHFRKDYHEELTEWIKS